MRRSTLLWLTLPLTTSTALCLLPRADAESLAAPRALGHATSTLSNAPKRFEIDNSHTAVVWKISHLGFSHTWGRFNRVSGHFTYDPAAPEASAVELLIEAESVDSNDEKRDVHLRSPDFFNVKQYPRISFRSTSVKAKGEQLEVTGEFELHGVKKTITVPMKKIGEGDSPFGDYRAGFDGEVRLLRSDFGMTGSVPAIGDEVQIYLSFEGIRG